MVEVSREQFSAVEVWPAIDECWRELALAEELVVFLELRRDEKSPIPNNGQQLPPVSRKRIPIVEARSPERGFVLGLYCCCFGVDLLAVFCVAARFWIVLLVFVRWVLEPRNDMLLFLLNC